VGKLVVERRGRPDRSGAHGARRLGHPEHLRAGRPQVRRCKAEFILLRREGRRLHRLNEDGFWKKHNCILMTSEGAGRRAARGALLQRMALELKLPIYVLVDNDPWGLYIYSVLKQGSINLAYESMRMAVPNVRFLGMSAFDYKKFKLMPKAAEIKLNEGGHRARRADEGLPLVQGQEVAAERSRSCSHNELQDGGSTAC
jgi:DNA topoisomerase VI subunit A